jgi:hypothetical protein
MTAPEHLPTDEEIAGALSRTRDPDDGAMLRRIEAAAITAAAGREPGAQVVAIAYDSVADEGWLRRVRSGTAPTERIITFGAASIVIELSIQVTVARRSLVGSVSVPAREVRIVHAEGRHRATIRDRRFAFDDLPSGPVRLSIRRGDQAPLETEWFPI